MTEPGSNWQPPAAAPPSTGPAGPVNPGEPQVPGGYFPAPAATPAGGMPIGQVAPRVVPRTPVVVLAVLVAVLVVTTGLFTTLFLVARGNHNQAQDRLTAVEKSIDDTNGQLRTAKSTLDDTERRHDDLESQNSQLHQCADSAKAAIAAAQGADEEAVRVQVQRMYTNCG